MFGVRVEGSLPGFFLVAVGIALDGPPAFGLLVAALGPHQAARGIAIFAVLVMVMLGGAWFPSFMFPGNPAEASPWPCPRAGRWTAWTR